MGLGVIRTDTITLRLGIKVVGGKYLDPEILTPTNCVRNKGK